MRRKVALKVIAGPGERAVLSAPPLLQASDHTIDFTCGKCGTILMAAELDQVHNLVIHCAACGAHNSTDI